VVSTLASINEVNQRQAQLVGYWGGWPYPGSVPGEGHSSRYVTSHPGQLSLAIPSWVGAMSTSQRAVMPCSWGVKAGMVRVWVAGKTVWSPRYTRAISVLIIKCYINSPSLLFLLLYMLICLYALYALYAWGLILDNGTVSTQTQWLHLVPVPFITLHNYKHCNLVLA